MLRLITFGGLAVRGMGESPAVPSVSRRGLAVLVAIAAAGEAGVTRDRLAALLWPESDEEHARNALRQTLHTLRRELAAPEVLVGGQALRLNPQIMGSDLQEFEAARVQGDLGRAVALYGGPFLEGFHLPDTVEFDQWAMGLRSEYTARVQRSIEVLARDAVQAGRFESAADWWRRRAAMDPLDSRVAMELMSALAAAGNPAAALRHAQVHESLLREELGAAPSGAFQAHLARIRAGAPPGTETAASPESSPRSASPHEGGFRARLERELTGRYAFEGVLQAGRDGSVRSLAARDLRHDRPVTIRVIHPALASAIDTRRFIREIELTGRLLHPHILPLLDSGEIDGRPWYVVPRPDGETLRARLGREPGLRVEEAVRVGIELAEALSYAHDQGIVHRDVAPEHVLLTGGHTLLTGLGVARALSASLGSRITDTGMLVGTPAYMSPEQMRGEPVDARTDVYSLGSLLFEMLAGEPLFSGPTAQAILAKRATEPAPSGERLLAVPPAFRPVLERALAPEADARFDSPRGLADALVAARGQGDANASPPPDSRPGWRSWLGLG